ncbi:hypothetical protein DAPPUDRAFT_310666 [Daphnia pulex]|uniref:Caspase family p20 domain-containing protein n=1 Tax=Daphnia pulex TaxID=6669 RepID=E9FV34_DAPPU|nr:hypothetical protein DAPPUDRAFT_310666 [Daphnia pulex]|eukprot:EFX89176.1 hypothetical protein DAPPUDRAFT_310666 [Daphnia pulex]
MAINEGLPQALYLYTFTFNIPNSVVASMCQNEDEDALDNKLNKNLMACWKETSKQLKGFFEGFGFVFDSKEVPSTEKLTTEVNDLVKKDLSEYQSIFVFVLTHGSYDRIWDVEGKSIEIQSLRKSLIDCHFLLGKPKVLVIEQCQTYESHSYNHVPNGT